ncbi:DHH family phosphoesterase [Vibrio crassostreae]|nr:DHH family phosphoesterase [Vibrio crassostreae]CAK2562926.1 DHH family phosphoesterase [Vibrio crassostreae]CAK2578500.1 DHH family phosphoesterase [Vibrio crassostreae]CAK2578750.1 DHH family phosphoesterase [Vibrio crassostreae]CAK2579012.1 DHH family phosphoesterase [Vibrio crassostreae]
MHYDVFNGDADGIIALLQLRFAEPKESILVTGVKRDIQLLKQVDIDQAESVTALDISMEKNLPELEVLLQNNVKVFYCDHHRSGDIPQSDNLDALINLDAEVCTSLLVNNRLGGQFAKWAVAAAFGDNLFASANKLAQEISLTESEIEFLKELGTLINYNGYGAVLNDLHIAPADLYQQLTAYADPLSLLDDESSPYHTLKKGYELDRNQVLSIKSVHSDTQCKVFELPCEAWARRISGVFGNELANQSPDLAHAVLTLNASEQGYTVSVRAPLNNRVGADDICSSFPTGGGRKAAAGINALTLDDKQKFINTLSAYYVH